MSEIKVYNQGFKTNAKPGPDRKDTPERWGRCPIKYRSSSIQTSPAVSSECVHMHPDGSLGRHSSRLETATSRSAQMWFPPTVLRVLRCKQQTADVNKVWCRQARIWQTHSELETVRSLQGEAESGGLAGGWGEARGREHKTGGVARGQDGCGGHQQGPLILGQLQNAAGLSEVATRSEEQHQDSGLHLKPCFPITSWYVSAYSSGLWTQTHSVTGCQAGLSAYSCPDFQPESPCQKKKLLLLCTSQI